MSPVTTATTVPSESPSSTASADLVDLLGAPLNGFAAIDPVTGDVHEIWLGSDRMWDIDVYPELTPGRDAVWLSWDNSTGESVRFDLDGNEVTRVPGVWADESPDGSVVLYYTLPADGSRHLIAQYADGTVDLGEACCGVARDDGRIAFLGAFTARGQSLLMYDPATDETWVVTEGVGRPGKDGVIYPHWSASGRFIFDYSFDETDPAQSYWIIADTETREVTTGTVERYWQRGPQGEEWLGEVVDGDLVYRDAVTGDEVLHLSLPDASIVYGRDLGGAIEVTTGRRTDRFGIEAEHRIVFDLEGNEVRRWEWLWAVTMTPHGLAAIHGENQTNCQAIEVEHPLFRGTLDCDADLFQWSPNGRFLAYRTTGQVHLLDLSTGETRSYRAGGRTPWIEWNHDGSRLVLRFGGGI